MKYANQAPKELSAMSAKFKKQYPALDLLPPSWWVQPKYDGVFAKVFTTTALAFTRTDETMHSIPHIEEAVAKAFGPGWTVFGEVWVSGWTHQAINGASRRHTPQPDLRFVIFDAVPTAAYDEGSFDMPYRSRYTLISNALEAAQDGLLSQVDFYRKGVASVALGEAAVEIVAQHSAYDGLIVRDPDAPWRAGACKEGEAIKVKPVLSLDLRIVGTQAEQRATKLGGFLTVEYKGVRSDVGSGLTQQQLEFILCGDEAFTGQIAEVECLGLTPDGKLREPRLKSIRHDTLREEDKT